MKLIKHMPFGTPVREMDRLFDRFFPSRVALTDFPTSETVWAPLTDFAETDDEYILRIEAPGMQRENFDVGLEGNVVTISGHRELGKDVEHEDLIWREREDGRFVRSVRLPHAVQTDAVTATYENGLLVVKLPKAERAMTSRIPVK